MYIRTRSINCTQCGKLYETMRTNVTTARKNYCSEECRKRADSIRHSKNVTHYCRDCHRIIGRFAPDSEKLNIDLCSLCQRRDDIVISVCEFCGVQFEAMSGGRWCTQTCKDRHHKKQYQVSKAECASCGKLKDIHPWRVEIGMAYCEKCANADNTKREKNHKTIVSMILSPRKMKCATCKHGIANSESDSGWECKSNARVCKPLYEARLYEER